MKYQLIHGVVAGLLSGLAGVVYQSVYENAMYLDFSEVINAGSIFGASVFGCVLMAIGYWLLIKFKMPHLKVWLNVLIVVLTFASILSPLGTTLPLDVEFPELFPGLAIPMHFFPALVFFGLDPVFRKYEEA
jgi:ABC-type Fe3+-siderophore transport system permease subunit